MPEKGRTKHDKFEGEVVYKIDHNTSAINAYIELRTVSKMVEVHRSFFNFNVRRHDP